MKWLILCLLPLTAFAKIKTQKIAYEVDGIKMEGTLAFNDKIKKPTAAVVIFPDWMGHGPYVQMRATQLAELGYIAFAADIYGIGNNPKDIKEAATLAAKYRNDRLLMRKHAQAALSTLMAQKNVDKNKVAAMGYCFGGTVSLELARDGAPIKALISFHGGLSTNMKTKVIKAKVLALHGGDDPFVSNDEVLEFQKELREAKADWQFVTYGNAVHGFTQKSAGDDPSKGFAYNELADKRSFEEMKRFLKETF